MIDLYTWTTPNGEKPIIMLEEVGLPYTLHLVDIGAGAQKLPEFLAINPNGRIPAITDEGQRVFESGAILVHLAEKTGKLLPATGTDRTETFAWMFFQAGGTGPMISQWHHFKSAAPEALPYAIERYRNETRRLLGVLDGRLEGRDFLAGDYSIADVMNFSWAKTGLAELGAEEEFPALAAWIGRIGARPQVIAALEKLAAAKKALG
ncbi:thiol:disulfide oxidoreductase [Aureimonas sp. SA4125]|uniref:glutathione S-transferase family protein n=1 Tax=Aureimonas sp. SA4125 TaxID=2826993 RepID=UPI001CC5599F|nr:glutathione S-transferase N-terminal domain-containing protein [Aureimonas sp. SA4125]BDA83213.1 thiol:disulfide oxidoreductase [Aureimonas sp. SA4125]